MKLSEALVVSSLSLSVFIGCDNPIGTAVDLTPKTEVVEVEQEERVYSVQELFDEYETFDRSKYNWVIVEGLMNRSMFNNRGYYVKDKVLVDNEYLTPTVRVLLSDRSFLTDNSKDFRYVGQVVKVRGIVGHKENNTISIVVAENLLPGPE